MTAVVAETGPDVGVPWHYGDPMREQRLLTGGEGVVDLSHRGVIAVTGPDRLAWLHSLTTQRPRGTRARPWRNHARAVPQRPHRTRVVRR